MASPHLRSARRRQGAGDPIRGGLVAPCHEVVSALTGAATFITSVDYQPVSLHALVQSIFGQLDPIGKLPVTITQPPPSTSVL